MKMIFIIMTKGLLVRNILRSDFFDLLAKDNDLRAVIFFPCVRKTDVPAHLSEEFGRQNVKVEFVPNKILSFREKIFNNILTSRLAFSKSTRISLKFSIKQRRRVNGLIFDLCSPFFILLSRLGFIKKIMRVAAVKFFHETSYGRYFEQYKPDLVFSSSIVSHFDVDFLLEAKRRKIKTVAMPKSWDNVDRIFFRTEPDLFLVQNDGMKDDVLRYQSLAPEKIKAVGFPQFDIYAKSEVFVSRHDYCQKKGFDESLPILFLGSEGDWSQGDEKIFEDIIKAREEGIISQCNVLIRPHFTRIFEDQYEHLKKYKNVWVDNQYRKCFFFIDNWDPSCQDGADFANSLYHCDLMVTFASTLALDAVCFGKPVIAITYGVRFINGVDRTKVMYETCHYQKVIDTDAVSLAAQKKQIFDLINLYLSNPAFKKTERKVLLEKLCHKLDGKAGERIFMEVKNLLK